MLESGVRRIKNATKRSVPSEFMQMQPKRDKTTHSMAGQGDIIVQAR